jgi:hypothetical protein
MFKSKKRWLAGAVIAVLVAAVGGSIAVATGAVGDDDEPLTGSTYERAVEAALEYTGGGTVTETEGGDDGAAYGVEVRLDDGRQVEVNLDEDFNVIGQEEDDDGPGDEDSDDD